MFTCLPLGLPLGMVGFCPSVSLQSGSLQSPTQEYFLSVLLRVPALRGSGSAPAASSVFVTSMSSLVPCDHQSLCCTNLLLRAYKSVSVSHNLLTHCPGSFYLGPHLLLGGSAKRLQEPSSLHHLPSQCPDANPTYQCNHPPV